MLYPYLTKFKMLLFVGFVLLANITYATATGGPIAPRSQMAADTIKGTVTDNDGNPLQNAVVAVKGSDIQAVTSATGSFVIPSSANVLSISKTGYYSQDVLYRGRPLLVQLTTQYFKQADSINVLYGKQDLNKQIAAASTIYNNQLISMPTSNILNAIAGRLSRVDVNVTSAMPAPMDGVGIYSQTLGSGANLIVVDGVPRNLTSIDPEEIESVTVLKDALATVMYGQRASNGVILITTKKGGGKPQISFTAESAIESPLKIAQPLNAFQYATLYNEAFFNNPNNAGAASGFFTPQSLSLYQSGADPYLHPNVNYYDAVLKKRNDLDHYNVNLQGSGNTVRYFVSLDFQGESGLLKESGLNPTFSTNDNTTRYIARANVGMDVSKTLTVDLNFFGRVEGGNEPGASSNTNASLTNIFNLLATTPSLAYPIFNPNGSLASSNIVPPGSNNVIGSSQYSGFTTLYTRDIAFDVDAKQKLDFITKGLYLSAKGSINSTVQIITNRSITPPLYAISSVGSGGSYTYQQYVNAVAQGNSSSVPNPNGRIKNTYVDGELGYDRVFGYNSVNAELVANQQATILDNFLPSTYTIYAGKISYSYKDKYLAEGGGSYSGYNRFAPGQQFGFFSAAGLGWVISKEDFFKADWINRLKLRISYGKNGNVNLTGYNNFTSGSFPYLTNYGVTTGTNQETDVYPFGTSPATPRPNVAVLGNPNATWERTDKFNLGFDASILKDRLTFSGDFFYNKAYDLSMLPQANVPAYSTVYLQQSSLLLGNTYPPENVGKTGTTGGELQITWQSKINDFNYFVSGNATMVKTVELYEAENAKPYGYQTQTGQAVQAFGPTPGNNVYGLIADGFYSQADVSNPSVPKYEGYTPVPGDIKYVDRNGDGVINYKDYGVINTQKPYIIFGLTFGFHYHQFDFSALIQGQANRQIYLGNTASELAFAAGGGNAFQFEYNDRWTPATAATATYPRVTIGSNPNNELVSTFWLYNNTFARLKNAEIGYTIPAYLSNKIHVHTIRFFVNGANLFTDAAISKVRNDFDPETGIGYPMERVINAGINVKL